MSDIDTAGMSHIGPKKGIARERVARERKLSTVPSAAESARVIATALGEDL